MPLYVCDVIWAVVQHRFMWTTAADQKACSAEDMILEMF